MKSFIYNSQYLHFTLIKPIAMVTLCLFLLGVSMPALALDCSNPKHADKRQCQDGGGGGGGNGHGSLVAKFALEITSSISGLGLHSDSDGIYFDSKKEKVIVGTGQGPGFRFDTNKSSTGKSTAVRFVDIHFPAGFMATDLDGMQHLYASGDYEIDFRFDLSSDGLELGDLEVGETAEVPIGIMIQSADKSQAAALGYGDAPMLFSNPILDPACMLEYTRNAVVIRTEDDAWTIQSNPANPKACLWFGSEVFEGLPSQPLEMPFYFTIVIDE